MSDMKVQGEFEMDTTKGEDALARVESGARRMANTVQQAGDKAANALGGMGDKADQSAKGIERANAAIAAAAKRAISESQRAIVEAQGYNLKSAEGLEQLARLRGADVNAISGQLTALKTLRAEQERLTKTLQDQRDVEMRSRQQSEFVNSLQSQVTAIGKTRSELLAMQAVQLGVSDKAAPMIARLREQEAGFGKLATSAGQTRAALAQLPMQFSDIFISLQGGQAPLTVFLQQGSQIKDSFGGAGAAVKAMGGYVLGLVTPTTVAAGALIGLGAAMAIVESRVRDTNSVATLLTATGRGADMTREQIESLRRELMLLPDVSRAAAQTTLTEFSKAREIGAGIFRELSLQVADFAAATGTDAPNAAKALAKAFSDPAKGAKELDEALGFLSASQVLAVQSMAAVGDKAGAQRVLLDALKTATSGLAIDGMTPLQRATDGFGNSWAHAMDVMDPVPLRAANDVLAGLIVNAGKLAVALAKMRLPPWLEESFKGGLNGMVYDAVVGDKQFQGNGATGSWAPPANSTDDSYKELLAQTSGFKAAAKAAEELRDKATSLRDAMSKLKAEGKESSDLYKAFASRLEGVNEQIAKAGKGAAGAAARAEKKDLSELAKTYAELNGVSTGYYQDLDRLQQQRAKGNITEAQYVELVEQLIQKQPFAVELTKAAAKASQEAAVARGKEAEGIQAWMQAQEQAAQQSLQSVQGRVEAMQDEERALSISRDLNVSLAEAVEMVAIARLQEKQAGFYENSEGWQRLQREINARKELLGLLGSKAAREANQKAAEDAAKDWERTAQLIGDTLADYIMGGGKDAAQYLKRLFATLVLQPTVQTLVGGILGQGGGLLGGAGGSLLGGSNPMSLLNLIGGTFGGGMSAGLGGLMGSLGLSSTGATLGGSLSAGSIALGSGNILGGLGTFAGALGPIVAGIGALASIISSLDGSGDMHRGATASWSAARGTRTSISGLDNVDNQFGTGMGWVEDDKATREGVANVASTLGGTLDALAKAFGDKLGFEVSTGWADDWDGEGDSWGALRIARDGKDLVNWNEDRDSKWAPRMFGENKEEGYKAYLAAIAQDTRQVLLDMDLPSWADTIIESLGEGASMEQLAGAVQQIGAIEAAFDRLGQTITGFAGLTDEARGAIMQASGGIEALAANASTFYGAFYSDDERLQAAKDQLQKQFADLGLDAFDFDAADARAEFRRVVEAQMGIANGAVSDALAGIFEGLDPADLAAGSVNVGEIISAALVDSGAQGDLGALSDSLAGLVDSADPATIRDQAQAMLEAAGISSTTAAETVAALLGLSGAMDQVIAVAEARRQKIADMRAGLEERLLSAQGNDRGLLDLRRKKEYDAYYAASPELAELVAQIYALEDASKAAADAAARAAEIEAKSFDIEQRRLIALGRDREALDLRRKQEYDALWKLSPALANATARVWALEDAAEGLAKAEAARGDAMRDLSDAMGRQREAWEGQLEAIDTQRTLQQESLGLITGIFDLVRSNARDLYGEVEATAAMQAAQGNAFIAQALAAAQTTGYLPEQDALQQAISAARGGLDNSQYASQVDADFARLVLAGQLKGLEEIAGPQKTAAEQQLDALDTQTEALNKLIRDQQKEYDLIQRQVDIANGTYNATITVAEATAKILELLGTKQPATGAAGGGAAGSPANGGAAWGGSAPSGGGGSPAPAPAPAKYSRLMYIGGSDVGRDPIRDQSIIDRLDALAPVYHSFDGTGDLVGLGNTFRGAGGTIADLSILSGNWEADWRKAFAGVGIEPFAKGGAFTNGVVSRPTAFSFGQMGEAGPEAIMPLTNVGGRLGVHATGGDNAALIAEVRALRQEVAGLRAAAESTADSNSQLAEQTDSVTEGGNANRVEIMNLTALAKALAEELAA